MGTTTWPYNLRLIKSKVEESTCYDDALVTDEGNGRSLLPPLLQEFQVLYPDDALRHMQKYNSSAEAPGNECDGESNDAPATDK